jgi:hypothetical protein
MVARIFMKSDIGSWKSFDVNRRIFTYSDNLHTRL